MKIISEVQILPVKPENGLIAFCSMVLYESIYCGSIAIMTRPSGSYRLVYPTKKIGVKNLNMFFPLNKKVASIIEQEVLKKLEDVMKNDRYCVNNFTR